MRENIYQIFQNHPEICTDTRKISDGAIFFALKGDNFNGNKFAEAALSKGCAYAIIDEAAYKKDERFILVDDVLIALQELAHHHRSTLKIPVIGITGSNGKTTTKELVAAVLSKQYETFATFGNLNNHIGVPLSILSIQKSTEIAIIEMGANHIGEIGELCSIAEPDFGLITNIGRAHLEGFGGLEGVIEAKKQLYDHLRENEGKAFVNMDNDLLLRLAEGMQIIGYGKSDNAIYKAQTISNSFLLEFDWEHAPSKTLGINTQLVGQYNFENAMAAVAIGRYFGVDPEEIKAALEGYEPSNNRSQQLQVGNNTVIMDAYNANPTSMSAALENFRSVDAELKMLVLGDMLELGEYSIEEHQKIVSQLQDFDLVYLVGTEFLKTNSSDQIHKFPSVDALTAEVKTFPEGPTHYLIKGSRGIKLEKFLEHLKKFQA